MNRTLISFSLLLCLFTFSSFSQTGDKTGLPYFYEQSNEGADEIPLSSIKADVNIAGNISNLDNRVIDSTPASVKDYILLASILANKGYIVDAISTCIKGLEAHPENEKLLGMLDSLISSM